MQPEVLTHPAAAARARRPLRVLVDATALQHRGKGLSRYGISLLRALASVDGVSTFDVLIASDGIREALPDAPNFRYRLVHARPTLAWRLLRLRRAIAQGAYDVLHVIGELAYVPPDPPLVLSVTELPHRRNAIHRPRGMYARIGAGIYERLFPWSLRRAARLLSISESTRWDVIGAVGVASERITATPLGVDDAFRVLADEAEKARFRSGIGCSDGYALSFATGDERENLELLLDAWTAAADGNRLTLVFAGCREDAMRARIQAGAAARGIAERVRVLGYIEEDALAMLYAAAVCYVDASVYEGFGLQCLEAMAAGTAVVASHIPAIVEVVGDAALLFDLPSSEDLAVHVRAVLADGALRARLVRAGLERARAFTWRRTAELTLEAYATVART